MDNRPLRFDEFERHWNQVIFFSATPGPYELAVSTQVVQQVIRPTGILDPEVTAGAVLELVAQLSVELATTQTLLQETMQAAPASPQIEPLRNRIAALQTQINAERRKVIGNDDAMALQLSEYERLLLEREFATKALASATLSLETARVEAQRQQLYLEAVVAPNNPDYPLLPRRLRAIFVVTASAFMIFGIGWLVSASVREHTGR